jgi:hypothetical protein
MSEFNLYDDGSGNTATEYADSETGEILLGALTMP